MKALELKVPPLALMILAAACMWAVSRVSPYLRFSTPGEPWVSAGIAISGALICILGVREFRYAGTTVDPRLPEQSANLVTSGVYRFSRNPMYVGFLIVLVGWGLFLGSAPSLLFIPGFVVYLNHFQIIPEERFMCAKFGASYNSYSSRVRRWI